MHSVIMVLGGSVSINSTSLTHFPLENGNSGSCNIIGNKISHQDQVYVPHTADFSVNLFQLFGETYALQQFPFLSITFHDSYHSFPFF